MPKVSLKKQKEPSNEPLKKMKVSYCCTKKRDLFKKNFIPLLKQKDLAYEYEVSEGMVSDILKEKDRWLAIDTESYIKLV